jgi:hypothetical protein
MSKTQGALSTEQKKVLKEALERLYQGVELKGQIDFSKLPPLEELESSIVKLTVMYVKAYNQAADTCNLPELDDSFSLLLEDSARRMISRTLKDLLSTYF